MSKGKYSITFSAVAAISFILAFFGLKELLVLVVAYALIAEGNDWLTKQTLQALYLCLSYVILTVIVDGFFKGLISAFAAIKVYDASSALATIDGFVLGIIGIVMFALSILAILNVIKNKDANLPLFGTLADKSMGVFTKKAVQSAPVQAPVPQYAPPPPAAQPAAPPPAKASNEWVCSCGKTNTGKFCAACGKPKNG